MANIRTNKNKEENNSNERITHFLLGLILIFSFLFTLLEYTSYSTDDYELDDDLLKKLPKETDFIPAPVPPSMPRAPKPIEKRLITNNIKVSNYDVEHTTQKQPLKLKDVLVGDGTADLEKAKIDRAIPEKPVNDDEKINKELLDELPEFPGGAIALMKWLTKNLKYPLKAQQQMIEGRVLVSFLVNKDGSLSEFKVEQKVNPLLDAEAFRVITIMPHWRPGKMKGKPCQTQISIPIVFQL